MTTQRPIFRSLAAVGRIVRPHLPDAATWPCERR